MVAYTKPQKRKKEESKFNLVCALCSGFVMVSYTLWYHRSFRIVKQTVCFHFND